MMAAAEPVVAELGRPETPEETAARKAASSKAYRSSQNVRNLLAALLATIAVVAVVYFAVPRGDMSPPPAVDVKARAAEVAQSLDRTVIVPQVPSSWRANSARIESGNWRVVYAPRNGFVTVSQGFDASADWAKELLGGYAATGRTTIDGITWDEYQLPASAAPLNYAVGTTLGKDQVLVYGSASETDVKKAAAGLTTQIQKSEKDGR